MEEDVNLEKNNWLKYKKLHLKITKCCYFWRCFRNYLWISRHFLEEGHHKNNPNEDRSRLDLIKPIRIIANALFSGDAT